MGWWERIPLNIDSGAIDVMIPPHAATFFPVHETKASKSGNGFRAANGTHIDNYSQRNITALEDTWSKLGMKAQVADVRTPLGSVYQILPAGNSALRERELLHAEHRRRHQHADP